MYNTIFILLIIILCLFKRCKIVSIEVPCNKKEYSVVLANPRQSILKINKAYNNTIVNISNGKKTIYRTVMGGFLYFNNCNNEWLLQSIMENPPISVPFIFNTHYYIHGYESVIYFTEGNREDISFYLPPPDVVNSRKIIIKTLTESPYTVEYKFIYKCKIMHTVMVETTCVTSYGDQPFVFILVPDKINDLWVIV